jgi:hypothetical protein
MSDSWQAIIELSMDNRQIKLADNGTVMTSAYWLQVGLYCRSASVREMEVSGHQAPSSGLTACADNTDVQKPSWAPRNPPFIQAPQQSDKG